MTPVSQTSQTAHLVLTGATIGGGLMEWVTLNSSFITVTAVALSSIAGVVLGIVNARTNTERNRINKHIIIEDLMSNLDPDKTYTAEEIRTKLNKNSKMCHPCASQVTGYSN